MSHHSSARLVCSLLFGLAAAMPGFAGSLPSSASSAASDSVGSVSDSLGGSSKSSSEDKKVAEGDYRVLQVAALDGRPGMLRLTMRAVDRTGAADSGDLTLDLPQNALKQRMLASGDVVTARQRAYGYEFAHADTRQAFFLVLADDWHRDLQSRPVTL
jgi:hypothetical protein